MDYENIRRTATDDGLITDIYVFAITYVVVVGVFDGRNRQHAD